MCVSSIFRLIQRRVTDNINGDESTQKPVKACLFVIVPNARYPKQDNLNQSKIFSFRAIFRCLMEVEIVNA